MSMSNVQGTPVCESEPYQEGQLMDIPVAGTGPAPHNTQVLMDPETGQSSNLERCIETKK